MINHLEKFFPDDTFPSLKAKFIAFLIWMQGAGRMAIKCQLSFAFSSTWMCNAAIQFTANSTGKVLGDLPELPGPKKIEHLLKSATFLVANFGTLSHVPLTKKQKINLNTPPSANRQTYSRGYQGCGHGFYGRGCGFGGGRGNTNLHHRYNALVQNISPFQFYPGYTLF